MKNIQSAIIKTISTNATVIGGDGIVECTGLTVLLISEPSDSEYDSRYVIGRTEHVAQDIVHEGDELRSLAAGWTVKLQPPLTMTADTMTAQRVKDLAVSLTVAAAAMLRLEQAILAGDVSPAEAAEEITETMRLLAVAAK
jgi:hypothetical protein